MRRLPLLLRPDPARVLLRAYRPAEEAPDPSRPGASRAARIVARALAMRPRDVEAELAAISRGFGDRHPALSAVLAARFEEVRDRVPAGAEVPEALRLLIGAYFSHEYAPEAASLCNPSIVAHPDQAGLADGEARFVLSLRGVGEGHISSVCFRSGIVDTEGTVRLDPPARHAIEPARRPGPGGAWPGEGEAFEVAFPPESALAERVLFPVTARQRNGIEDARLVRFVDDDGTATYYATCTAYSGRGIAPELLRTDDFRHFRFLPLGGDAARDKGMALFPRRVGGRYAMLARLDGENLQLARSDDLGAWSGAVPVLAPAHPWEFVQIGNCGSPIELPEGWLVLTHGVGPMRRYAIGAALLDLDDPGRVLARLPTPLVAAEGAERDGYVPNVAYSCGAMLHAGRLLLPFAVSDTATTFAVVAVRDLLGAMR